MSVRVPCDAVGCEVMECRKEAFVTFASGEHEITLHLSFCDEHAAIWLRMSGVRRREEVEE